MYCLQMQVKYLEYVVRIEVEPEHMELTVIQLYLRLGVNTEAENVTITDIDHDMVYSRLKGLANV